LIVGVWMYSPSKRFRYNGAPSSIPYHGQKRLHTILGLLFGMVACTWAFSGMLSLDPFPMGGAASTEGISKIQATLRGDRIPLAQFPVIDMRGLIDRLAPEITTREIEFASFRGEPFLLLSAPQHTVVVSADGHHVSPEFDRELILKSARAALTPWEIVE